MTLQACEEVVILSTVIWLQCTLQTDDDGHAHGIGLPAMSRQKGLGQISNTVAFIIKSYCPPHHIYAATIPCETRFSYSIGKINNRVGVNELLSTSYQCHIQMSKWEFPEN